MPSVFGRATGVAFSVLVQAHRALPHPSPDDILTVLRLAKEFGFAPVRQHVSEGWKVAAEIARAGASCSVIVVDAPGGRLEAADLVSSTPIRSPASRAG